MAFIFWKFWIFIIWSEIPFLSAWINTRSYTNCGCLKWKEYYGFVGDIRQIVAPASYNQWMSSALHADHWKCCHWEVQMCSYIPVETSFADPKCSSPKLMPYTIYRFWSSSHHTETPFDEIWYDTLLLATKQNCQALWIRLLGREQHASGEVQFIFFSIAVPFMANFC